MTLTNEEKIELFDEFIQSASMEVERRFNGRRTLKISYCISSGGVIKNPVAQKLDDYFDEIRNNKTRDKRYEEYLKLKGEFENE